MNETPLPPPEPTTAETPLAAAQSEKPMAESANPAAESAAVQQGEQRPVDPADADDVLTKKLPGSDADAEVLRTSASGTRRSFVVAGIAAAAGYGLYHSLGDGPGDEDSDNFLRRVLRFNAGVSRAVLPTYALSPTYPLSRAENLRINGVYGLKRELDVAQWRLQLVGMQDEQGHPRYTKDVTAWAYRYRGANDGDMGHDTKVDPAKEAAATTQTEAKVRVATAHGDMPVEHTAEKMASEKMMPKAMADEEKCDTSDEPDANGTGRKSRGNEEAGESNSTLHPNTPGLLLQMADITRLPRHELVTQFKCIEGWSQIVHWAGFRMADFLDLYPPAPIDGKEPKYVYMETPDGDYYTGYDMAALRHPQALLVTEMMGEPLTQFHGAPLRLHMPTKYGYKQIKRIGLIAYTNDRPDDYWTKLGYDWFAGL